MRNHLNVTYPNRWIGRGGPVPWSPDLAPLDYFQWGSMKSVVYGTPVTPEEDLIARVHGAIAAMYCIYSVYLRHVKWTLRCSTAPKPCGSGQGFRLENNQLAILHNKLSVVGVF